MKMLDQAVHWMEIAGIAIEALLLVRILLLKLHRLYAFITLYAVVNLFIDGCSLAFGLESDPSARIFLYSRFVFAAMYPLAAWDSFEEIRTQVTILRRLHLPRFVFGLLITALFGFILSLGIEDQDLKGTSSSTDFIGLFLWLGSACSSLLFTLSVIRGARKQNAGIPRNTFVWTTFFIATFILAIIDCGFDVAGQVLPHPALQAAELMLVLFDVSLAVWCLVRLRPLPADMTPAPEKAGL